MAYNGEYAQDLFFSEKNTENRIMIEKIDQIRDLLIVPDVGEQPKIAINQMKILNLLVELRGEAERCNISNDLWQSEQLHCSKCENGLIWSEDRLKGKTCDCGK